MGAILEFYWIQEELKLPEFTSDQIISYAPKRLQRESARIAFEDRLVGQAKLEAVELLVAAIRKVGRHVESLTINSNIIGSFERQLEQAGLSQLLRSPLLHGPIDTGPSCGWIEVTELPQLIDRVEAAGIEELEDVVEWLRDADWAKKNVATIWT